MIRRGAAPRRVIQQEEVSLGPLRSGFYSNGTNEETNMLVFQPSGSVSKLLPNQNISMLIFLSKLPC